MIKRLIGKYKSLTKPLKASLWFMVSSVINKAIAFLTTPFFSRLLTQEEYGIVGLYSTWLVILNIVITLELATGVFNKAMIKFEDDKDGYTSSSLALTTVIIIFFGVIYLLFHKPFDELIGLSPTIIRLMYAEILSTTTWDLFAVRKRFDYEYLEIVIVTILANVFATAFSLFLVIKFPEHRAEARVAGLVITHCLIYSIFYVRIFLRGKTLVNVKYWAYSIKYNLPLIPHYLSQQILNQSDRIMISNLRGNAEAGIYTLAYQVAVVIQIVTNAVHVTFMPWCFQCLRDNEPKKIGKRAFQIELIIGVLCLIFSLFAPEFVLVLGGKTYYSAIYIVPPVSMSVIFLTMYSLFANIEFYYEKTKIVMSASVLAAGINIVLNGLFIPIYGFIAAGYTTLFCYIIYAAVHYYYMLKVCREEELDVPFNGKKMWIVAVGFATLSVGMSIIYKYAVLRITISLISLFSVAGVIAKKKLFFCKQ